MARCSVPVLIGVLAVAIYAASDQPVRAQPDDPSPAPVANEQDSAEADSDGADKLIEIPGLTRISKLDEVWIDAKQKLVVVDGQVVLRRGVLELLVCTKGTKEYESIISVNSKASIVHTGLLAVGAKPGSPVHFNPDTFKVTPAHGPVIDIWILWKDKDGMNRKVKAQEWVRHITTQEEMTHEWVFGGSHLIRHPDTGEMIYEADGTGELICVSNFATATMDLPIASSADASDLLFEPFTERIPEKGTHVRIVLKPRLDKPAKEKTDGEVAPNPAIAPIPEE